MRKQRDARIVTLLQDYAPEGKIVGADTGTPFVKGSKHAMHEGLVKFLESVGVKMKVEKPDFEKMYAEIKERRRKDAERQKAVYA